MNIGTSVPLPAYTIDPAFMQGESAPGGGAMEVAIHLPDDVAAAVPWDDLPCHLVEQIALEGIKMAG